jgi:tetratricopeptide (TPR) repeat protein
MRARIIVGMMLLAAGSMGAQAALACVAKATTPAGGDTAVRVAALMASGHASIAKKEFAVAADSFKKASELDPKSAEAFLWYGNALGQAAATASSFKQAFMAPKMKHAWERAVQLDSCNVEARESLVQFYEQAPGIMGGSMDKARAELAEIKAIDPYRGEIQAANLAQRQKDLPGAAAAYETASKMPADSTGRAWGGWVFVLEEQGNFTAAFAAIDARLAKKPGDLVALTLLGRGAAMSGQRLPEGLAALKTVMADSAEAASPRTGFRISTAGLHYRTAMILALQADTVAALAEYKQAVALAPKDKTINEAAEKFEKAAKH